MAPKHLPEYLSVAEDLYWILLRTVEGACLGVIALVLGWAGLGVADLAMEYGTLRPYTLISAAHGHRQDVVAAVARIGTIGKVAVFGFVTAFVMEQLLMIKAYLRALAAKSSAEPKV